jgi:hypothetical protein
MDWRSQEEAQLRGHATPASKATKPAKRSTELWSHAPIVCSTTSSQTCANCWPHRYKMVTSTSSLSWTCANCWPHRYKMVTSASSLSQMCANCWPHRHKMVTSTSSLLSTTMIVKSPSMNHVMNYKLDGPSSFRQDRQLGKWSRFSILTAVANTWQATSKRSHTMPLHHIMPYQPTSYVTGFTSGGWGTPILLRSHVGAAVG